jgi:hypothetical protein
MFASTGNKEGFPSVMTTVRVNRPEKESSLVFIQVRMDQRNTNIRKKENPAEIFQRGFEVTPTELKLVPSFHLKNWRWVQLKPYFSMVWKGFANVIQSNGI